MRHVPASEAVERVPGPESEVGRGAPPPGLTVAYLSLLLGVGAAMLVVVGVDGASTLAGVLAVWAIASLTFRPGRRTVLAGGLVVIVEALLWRNYPELSPSARAWGLVGLGICVAGVYAVPIRRVRDLPVVAVFCSVQAAYLFVSVLLARPDPVYEAIYSEDVREAGFRTIALFMAVLVGSAAVLHRALPGRGLAGPAVGGLAPGSAARALVLFGAGFVGDQLLLAFDVQLRLGTLAQIPRLLSWAGMALLFLMWLRGELALLARVSTVALLGLTMLVGLGTGLLYQAALPGFVLLAVLVAERRRVPWAALLMVALALSVVNAGKQVYRSDARQAQGSEGGVDTGVVLVGYVSGVVPELTTETYLHAAHRFSNSDLLGYFVTWTPDRYPYFGSTVYSDIPTVLVPRALLPDKPTFPTANIIGREYELLDRSDLVTSLNTPLAAEAYVSGGPVYLVVVAVGAGAYLFLLGRLFSSARPAVFAAGCTVAVTVLGGIESGVYPMLLAVPFGGLVMLVFRLLFAED